MNKDKSLFKNKFHMVASIFLFFLLIACFIYLGSKNYKENNDNVVPDTNKYYLSDLSDTVFVKKNGKDISSMLNSGDSIILFGNTKNVWSNKFAEIVNGIAKEKEISNIYYYDIVDDRLNNSLVYEVIVEKLKNYLYVNDLGEVNIYAPTLVIIKNGRVLYINDDTALVKGDVTVDSYWNMFQVELFKNNLANVLDSYKE